VLNHEFTEIQEVDDSAAEWAREESARFKVELERNRSLFITGCRLFPICNPNTGGCSSTMLSGHSDRTLVLRNIPGKCPKEFIKFNVTTVR
jgi:hypothetical protein